MRVMPLTMLFAAVAVAVSAQTPPVDPARTPSAAPTASSVSPPSTGQQPAGLGTTGEGGVTAGSLGIGAGPAAVVNAPGAAVRDPLRPAGAAGPLRADPTSPDRPTPPASAYSDWSATGGADTTAPPSAYRGATGDWARHVAACRARYRTYDARTDMFFAQPGVQARCRL